jgi:hypothetical protein
MFLTENILNEGRTTAYNTKIANRRHSEGKNPKSVLTETKLPTLKSTKSRACVNSNWQKLRG